MQKNWPSEDDFQEEKPFIVPIPAHRNMEKLHENLGAIYIHLTPADILELNTASSKIKIRGGRMNEMQMQVVDK
jgi:diketogulonate reductase-like aldo/keto reductase